jgi:hypothetical protein
MAKQTIIRVVNGGIPVPGVDVTAGEMDVTKTTDANGEIVNSVPDNFKRAMLMAIDTGNYTIFTRLLIVAGETYIVELGE